MAQHPDFVISNNTPAALRADINAALLALATNNSGTLPPLTTYPAMLWADTSAAKKMKIRNLANTDWIIIGDLDVANFGLAPANLGLTRTGPVIYDQIGGAFRTGAGAPIQSVTATSTNRQQFTSYNRFDGFTSDVTSSQGVELITAAISTVQASSQLRFDVTLHIQATATPLKAAVGLFKDSATAPISFAYMATQGPDVITLSFFTTSSSSSASTYKVRFGATTQNGAFSDAFYFNSQPSALSALVTSSLIVTELSV